MASGVGHSEVLVADISEREVIVALLARVGLPTEAPPVARAQRPAFELA
jgi:hypothetical protein